MGIISGSTTLSVIEGTAHRLITSLHHSGVTNSVRSIDRICTNACLRLDQVFARSSVYTLLLAVPPETEKDETETNRASVRSVLGHSRIVNWVQQIFD